jgi:hypothetical protein
MTMQDVTFTWKGEEYRVEAREVLPLIARVEEVITLGELADASSTGKVPIAKLSKAFAVALRYAGAKVTDEEMYAGMFAGGNMVAVRMAIMALLGMMIPPEYLQDRSSDSGKKKGAKVPAADSAKKHTKPA